MEFHLSSSVATMGSFCRSIESPSVMSSTCFHFPLSVMQLRSESSSQTGRNLPSALAFNSPAAPQVMHLILLSSPRNSNFNRWQ